MILIAVAQTTKVLGVVTDDDRVHALGNGDLPRVVLSPTVRGATLTQSHTPGVPMADDLPAKGAKEFVHDRSILGTLKNLRGRYGRDPTFHGLIARYPRSSWARRPRSDFAKEVDHER